MASIAKGESSSATNPVLDVFFAAGNPPIKTDVQIAEFRIFDISTPAKKGVPVQVFPATAGTFQSIDPQNDAPVGQRLGTIGRVFAPWTVPLDAAIGDYKIEWRWQKTPLHPQESSTEEFYVAGESLLTAESYCRISDIRAEGFDAAAVSDDRILFLGKLATLYIKKMTGRWFHPLTFDEMNPLKMDGYDTPTTFLEIPIIRLDAVQIENQGFLTGSGDLYDVDLNELRVYNRHMSGLQEPDDRENPKVSFIRTSRINQVVSSGIFPTPRMFPKGRLNVHFQGVFGYTDPDGSAFGKTPDLIAQAACKLVIRNMILESKTCEALARKNKYRIILDKQGTTTIGLQELWLKGAFTGDPEIDQVLMAYKRPPRMAVV